MPLKGQHRVVAHHAASVVADLDKFLAARLDADLDPGGARVEGVLEHFFDDGGRPFDHLAGGDLVGNSLGKNVDTAHEYAQFQKLFHDQAKERCSAAKAALILRSLRHRTSLILFGARPRWHGEQSVISGPKSKAVVS